MPESPTPKLREAPAPTASATVSPFAYAELDVKTNFSFLRGASHPDELVYRAAELGYRAIAVTDFNSLAGVVRAHHAAKEAGIHLLIGARLAFADAPDLLVWAPDRAAYARLCRLLTLGKRRAEKGECALRLEDFLSENEGLIAAVVWQGEASDEPLSYPLSPVLRGEGWGEGQNAQFLKNQPFSGDIASPLILTLSPEYRGEGTRTDPRFSLSLSSSPIACLRDALGSRLSLAVSCAYGSDDVAHLSRAAGISRYFGIPLLATNDVYYHDPSRRALQDVLSCVRHGCTIRDAGYRLFSNSERYLKLPEKMHRLFADYPGAIRRGIEIAEACQFSLDELKYEYPDEVVPAGKTSIQHLSDLAWQGAGERYPTGIPDKVRQLVERELVLIEELHFEHYFLTVHDLVAFARSRGILCQGRGSAANSAVCYCIGVTSVDPDRIDVLFERFISSARAEPPDIDIDFEHERREEVIQYVYEKYGRDRAGMTAEVITYRGRSAVRDVGKAMGLSLDMVDSLAGKLDWWHSGTISDEQVRESGLDPADRTTRLVIDLTTQLLGFPRHLSQHVGGMVMTRGPLSEMVPIENASMEGRTVIEWDKDDIDEVGILKVDVLGLGMLTCISKAFRLVEEWDGKARRHEGTKARREEDTEGKARRHEGTEARREEDTEARRDEDEVCREESGYSERERNLDVRWKSADIQGSDCVATGNGFVANSVLRYSENAAVREISAFKPDVASGVLDSFQYRGGICQAELSGLSEIPSSCARIAGGTIDTIRAGDDAFPHAAPFAIERSDRGGRSNPSRIDSKPGTEIERAEIAQKAPLILPPSPLRARVSSPLRAFVPSCLRAFPSSSLRASVPSCLRAFPHPLQLHTLPPEDPLVYDMIDNADTIGVFQIESRAQMTMLPRLRPRNFYDLVIEVAIVRPGPIQGDMVHPYLRRRKGEEPVEYPSEELRQVLGKTLGVPLFQEQAMRLVMVAANFSAEQADKLRRAMAAWRRNGLLEQFHPKVVEGMLKNGYTREFAERCFQQIRGFGEYGFPESHAASFALLVYASAWLKCHHPAAFAAALLNSQPMGFYAPAQIVRDARDHGVQVRAVDVNQSGWDCSLEMGMEGEEGNQGGDGAGSCRPERTEGPSTFSCCSTDDRPPVDSGRHAPAPSAEKLSSASLRAFVPSCLRAFLPPPPSLRLGFRQIKGFREAHAKLIVESREQSGKFSSIEQFHQRTCLPVSALRRLAEADAFGSMNLSRRQALWQVTKLKDQEYPLFENKGDVPLFSRIEKGGHRSFLQAKKGDTAPLSAEKKQQCPPFLEPAVCLPAMPVGQEVTRDYATIGLSLKRHPVALVREELDKRRILSAKQMLEKEHGQWVKVAGLVLVRQRPGTASGVVFATIEDESGTVNLILHPRIYDCFRPAARHARLLQADGYVQREGQVIHVLAKRLFDLSSLLAELDVKSRDFH